MEAWWSMKMLRNLSHCANQIRSLIFIFTLSIPRIRTNTGARAFSSCAPSLWSNLPLSVRSATSVATFRRRPNLPLRLSLPVPVDTGVSNGLLMLPNSLDDFVFEHQSVCCTTEPGYAGDIGAIEIWLIDWFIDGSWQLQFKDLLSSCTLWSTMVRWNVQVSNCGEVIRNRIWREYRKNMEWRWTCCFSWSVLQVNRLILNSILNFTGN